MTSSHRPYQIKDSFFAQAQLLRAHFDRQFADPLHGHSARFVWDYWHVPNEYTVLRTPAYAYFPKSTYERFHRHLVRYGREVLGCHDISPPWLSCYIEGCRQEPHRDVPHGPLAFVYSLTPWARRVFRGGETQIFGPRVNIEPRFNRLTVFNPSLLHGVRQVRGTHDPRQGRLVIHGWFVNPRPFWIGPLTVNDVRDAIEGELPKILGMVPDTASGLLSLRLDIGSDGCVRRIDTLINTAAASIQMQPFTRALRKLRFARRPRGSRLTLPMRFD